MRTCRPSSGRSGGRTCRKDPRGMVREARAQARCIFHTIQSSSTLGFQLCSKGREEWGLGSAQASGTQSRPVTSSFAAQGMQHGMGRGRDRTARARNVPAWPLARSKPALTTQYHPGLCFKGATTGEQERTRTTPCGRESSLLSPPRPRERHKDDDRQGTGVIIPSYPSFLLRYVF